MPVATLGAHRLLECCPVCPLARLLALAIVNSADMQLSASWCLSQVTTSTTVIPRNAYQIYNFLNRTKRVLQVQLARLAEMNIVYSTDPILTNFPSPNPFVMRLNKQWHSSQWTLYWPPCRDNNLTPGEYSTVVWCRTYSASLKLVFPLSLFIMQHIIVPIRLCFDW